MRLTTLIPLFALMLSVQGAEQPANPPAQNSPESTTKPAPKIDPKPQIIKLIGGKVMFLGVDAEGSGVWRTPGVITRVQGTFDSDLVTAVPAELDAAGKPARPAGVRVQDLYIARDGSNEDRVVAVDTVYREDGSVDPPILASAGENRTRVVPLIGGKSALFVKNRQGQRPICAGIYDSDLVVPAESPPKGSDSKARPDEFEASCLRPMRNGDLLCFAPVYRADGSFEPPHAWGTGKKIDNRTQVIELIGGESAFLLADPKNARALLKGIYPDSQLHSSSDGILVTEQYLTTEGDILSLDTLYGPEKPARFVGARLGDQPIQNRDQVIKLAGNRNAVFTADPHAANGVPRFKGF